MSRWFKNLCISVLGNAAWEVVKTIFWLLCGIPLAGAAVAITEVFRALYWWQQAAIGCSVFGLWMFAITLPRLYKQTERRHRLRNPVGDEEYIFDAFVHHQQRTVTLPACIETANRLVREGLLVAEDKPCTYSVDFGSYEYLICLQKKRKTP